MAAGLLGLVGELAEPAARGAGDMWFDAELAEHVGGGVDLVDAADGVGAAAGEETLEERGVGAVEDVLELGVHPRLTAGRAGGGERLDRGGRHALHEDASEELPR